MFEKKNVCERLGVCLVAALVISVVMIGLVALRFQAGPVADVEGFKDMMKLVWSVLVGVAVLLVFADKIDRRVPRNRYLR